MKIIKNSLKQVLYHFISFFYKNLIIFMKIIKKIVWSKSYIILYHFFTKI
jgi:hypothetical protein